MRRASRPPYPVRTGPSSGCGTVRSRPTLVVTRPGPSRVTGDHDDHRDRKPEGRAGRPPRRSRKADVLPIGEVDANIFACPACTRPLANGTSALPRTAARGSSPASRRRAPRCFVGIGVFMRRDRQRRVRWASRPWSRLARPKSRSSWHPPVVTADARRRSRARRPPPVVDPGIPSSALSALGQSARINQRLLADAGRADDRAGGAETVDARDRADPADHEHERGVRRQARSDGRGLGQAARGVRRSRRVLRRRRRDGRAGPVGVAPEQPGVLAAAERMLEVVAGARRDRRGLPEAGRLGGSRAAAPDRALTLARRLAGLRARPARSGRSRSAPRTPRRRSARPRACPRRPASPPSR